MATTSAAALAGGHEHTLRRLETFSDIVIAFTLSQLAFTLRVPSSSRDLLAHPIHIVAFLASFTFVCGLWWLHHRLFARYFYPDTPSILLNFAFLASTVYVAYSWLLLSTFGDMIALGAYGLSVGLAYALIAVLFMKGLRDPRIALDDDERATGSRIATRIGVAASSCLLAGLAAMLGRPEREVLGVLIGGALVVVVLAVRHRLARRPREPEQPTPGSPA